MNKKTINNFRTTGEFLLQFYVTLYPSCDAKSTALREVAALTGQFNFYCYCCKRLSYCMAHQCWCFGSCPMMTDQRRKAQQDLQHDFQFRRHRQTDVHSHTHWPRLTSCADKAFSSVFAKCCNMPNKMSVNTTCLRLQEIAIQNTKVHYHTDTVLCCLWLAFCSNNLTVSESHKTPPDWLIYTTAQFENTQVTVPRRATTNVLQSFTVPCPDISASVTIECGQQQTVKHIVNTFINKIFQFSLLTGRGACLWHAHFG